MARLRFASRAPVCATVVLPVEDFSANGQQCLNRLCQPRGQAQIGTQVLIFLTRVWQDRRGQDLIEYALMAGFVAVAAGAIMPGVASSISTIFSDVGSVLAAAAS